MKASCFWIFVLNWSLRIGCMGFRKCKENEFLSFEFVWCSVFWMVSLEVTRNKPTAVQGLE